jgi:hypothetical protein
MQSRVQTRTASRLSCRTSSFFILTQCSRVFFLHDAPNSRIYHRESTAREWQGEPPGFSCTAHQRLRRMARLQLFQNRAKLQPQLRTNQSARKEGTSLLIQRPSQFPQIVNSTVFWSVLLRRFPSLLHSCSFYFRRMTSKFHPPFARSLLAWSRLLRRPC